MTRVGIIVNPASGHDIRRLISAATVVDNSEKGAMTVRLLSGLGATGVDEVLMMPADLTVSRAIDRIARSLVVQGLTAPLPSLTWLDLPTTYHARDTIAALAAMVEAGVDAVCVLGGDGTQRLVHGRVGEIPVLPLSTGTNNIYPVWTEATVAGIAAGLVATGQVSREQGCVREKALEVTCAGRTEAALVDVGVISDTFAGARAIWRPDHIHEVVVCFADPCAIGLSSIAASVIDLPRGSDHGAKVVIGDGPLSRVPIAPGLVVDIPVAEVTPVALGQTVSLLDVAGTISVDGEREIERYRGEPATVTLTEGPWRIDVGRVLGATRLQRAST